MFLQGTQGFMAVEVAEGMYMFRAGDTFEQDPVFYANPIHDLESMWWLLIWSVFSHIPESSEHLYDAEAVSQQSAARKTLFFDQKERMLCLMTQTLFYRHYRSRLPHLLGPLASGAHRVLATLRDMYTKVEKSFPIPTSAFDGVHEAMMASMASMKKNLVGSLDDVKFVRLGAVGKQLLEKERRKDENQKKRKRQQQEQAAEQQPNSRMRLEDQD